MSNCEEGGGDSFVTDVVSCQCLMGCNFEFSLLFLCLGALEFLLLNNCGEIFFPEFLLLNNASEIFLCRITMLDETQLVSIFLFIFLSFFLSLPFCCGDVWHLAMHKHFPFQLQAVVQLLHQGDEVLCIIVVTV